MKKVLFILLTLSLFSCLTEPRKEIKKEQIENYSKPEPIEDKKIIFSNIAEGKYPTDINIFENTDFTKRLKNLIGNRYDFLIDYWNLEMPIELNSKVYIFKGCQRHNCHDTSFIITYNLSLNYLSVGIRNETVVETFSERDYHPSEIDDWKNDW
ncbi:hypothetical protein GW796_11350 [archaeon]|nr:hypothetical protein [archaeon]